MIKLKYDFTLIKYYWNGYEDDGYDYDVEDYEYEIDEEVAIELISEWENCSKDEVRVNFDAMLKEYYWDLRDEFMSAAKEQAQEDLDNGEIA